MGRNDDVLKKHRSKQSIRSLESDINPNLSSRINKKGSWLEKFVTDNHFVDEFFGKNPSIVVEVFLVFMLMNIAIGMFITLDWLNQ